MATPILTTKLYTPPPRRNLVPRPRLIEQLNVGYARKLTLISAPAGFGKSTLLSSWAAQIKPPRVAWLSLDEGDNDLTRFLTYFVAAFQTIESKIGEQALSAFQSPGGPNSEIVLTSLLNDIAEFQQDLFLILDDFHVIQSRPIYQALTFLLDHQPANMHLVIATRVDPLLPLARLRARREMTELRTANLRFDFDEAAAFLNQVMGLGLAATDIAALETRTEGWIAGLQLAALSLQESDDMPFFIQSFTGSHHHILDYLVEEVLGQQPAAMQSFLLQTSILARLTGPLCDAVCRAETSQISGEENLEQLEKSNLFIVSLDDERQWYRYHQLFADLLQARLQRYHPERLKKLHLRAVEWYTQNGFMTDAINHAFKAEDHNRAADLIEGQAKTFLYQGETQVQTMLGWFKKFPEKTIQERPLLHVYLAWALVLQNPFENSKTVERMLLRIQQLLEKADVDKKVEKTVVGHIASMQGLLSQPPLKTDHDPHAVLATLHKAQSLLPSSETEIRSDNSLSIGYEYLYLEDTEAALKANQVAFTEAQAGKNHLVSVISIRNKAWIAYCLGELDQAVEICQEGITSFNILHANNSQSFPGIGILLIMLGYLHTEQGKLSRAEIELTKGFNLLQWFGEYEALCLGLIALMRLSLLKGNDTSGLQIGKRFGRHWSSCASLVESLQVQYAIAHFESDSSSFQSIPAWIKKYKPNFEAASDFQGISPWALTQQLAHLTWIQAQIIFTHLEDELTQYSILPTCLDYLDRQLESAQRRGLVFRNIECSIIKAMVLNAQGEYDQASACLRQVLELAETHGFVRPFLDKGRPFKLLLRKATETDIAPTYVNKLLSTYGVQDKPNLTAFPAKAKEPVQAGSVAPTLPALVEPLTDRELEVLCLIAEGLTYKEISGQILVSLNTVRTHVKNVYSKLLVHKRSQAIAKAKELNIL